jgi:hypothetical protein
MITIEDPILEKKILQAAKKNGTTADGYLVNLISYIEEKEQFDFDVLLREENPSYVSENVVKEINDSRKQGRE